MINSTSDPTSDSITPAPSVSVSLPAEEGSVSVSKRGHEIVCGRCGENIQRRGCSCDAGRGRHEAPRQGWKVLTKGKGG